jgi:hypothetical protein
MTDFEQLLFNAQRPYKQIHEDGRGIKQYNWYNQLFFPVWSNPLDEVTYRCIMSKALTNHAFLAK